MKTSISRTKGVLKIKSGYKTQENLIVRLENGQCDVPDASLMLCSLKDAWTGSGKYDFSSLDNLNKDKKYIVRIDLQAPDWWKKEYGFSFITQTVACEKWICDSTEFLLAAAEKCDDLPNVLALQLSCGDNGWDWGFDTENVTEEKLSLVKEETKNKSFSLSPADLKPNKTDAFVSSDALENVFAYRKLALDLCFETVEHFAHSVKSHTKKLIGVEFACPFAEDGEALWSSGQLCFDNVFESEYIDFISSGKSVHTGTFATLFDSLDLHEKLYFHLANESSEGAFTCDFIHSLIKGSAISVSSKFFVENKEKIKKLCEVRDLADSKHKANVSETLVLYSAKSMFAVNSNSGLNDFLFTDLVNSLSKLGAPFDIFSFADFDDIDFSSYKLIIFADIFKISKSEREKLELLKNDGKTLLWMYAPDYYGDSLARLQNMADMSIVKLIGDETSVATHLGNIEFDTLPEPRFFVEDSDTMPLGVYPNTEKTAIGLKKFGNYTSCFCGVGRLNGAILNDIARIAEINLYSIDNASVFADSNLLGAYAYETSKLFLPRDGEVTDLLTGKKFKVENKKLTLEKGEAILIKL